MSANWTENDLRAYTTRRLKDEEPRRLEMQAKAQRRAAQEAATKKVAGSGNRHNPTVVLAFFRHHSLPEPVPEYRFDPERKWRFDWSWPEVVISEDAGRDTRRFRYALVALEVQGGIWTHGRHVRPAAMLKEFEKLNRAATLGWRILFVTPDQLLTKATVDLVREALAI